MTRISTELTRQPKLAELLIPASEAGKVAESELILRAQIITNGSAWVVGQCASIWCERFAKGRTDEDFAKLIGMSRQQVNNRRRVYERFCSISSKLPSLTFWHFATAIAWDDAEACLEWAEENSTPLDLVSIEEMRSYRCKVLGHEESTNFADEPLAEEPEPDLPASETKTKPDQLEHDRDPAEQSGSETTTPPEYTPFRSEAKTPHEQLSDQSAADRVKAIRSGLRIITRAFEKLAEINDERIGPVLSEHVDRLLDEFDRGDEIGGLDEKTFEGMMR